MSTRDQLLALAERCEREEPSRELDAAVENAIAGGSAGDLAHILTDVESTTRPPHYTTSLDAAVTLVPETAEAYSAGKAGPAAAGQCFGSVDNEECWAKTPALALCAAALRARAAMEAA